MIGILTSLFVFLIFWASVFAFFRLGGKNAIAVARQRRGHKQVYHQRLLIRSRSILPAFLFSSAMMGILYFSPDESAGATGRLGILLFISTVFLAYLFMVKVIREWHN